MLCKYDSPNKVSSPQQPQCQSLQAEEGSGISFYHFLLRAHAHHEIPSGTIWIQHRLCEIKSQGVYGLWL